METPVIRYNLRDRGRKHTGQPRNFNLKAVCDAINSPACQETVASRGMLGYYGHLPRLRYGMRPVEGGIEGGKYKEVVPALVTTYLKADYNGNIEHRAEFLNTTAGEIAAKLWNGKVGGFSSAIGPEPYSDFFGFDYVAQPNYLGNSFRGVALDDAFGGGGMAVLSGAGVTYDDVYSAEQDEQAQAMIYLLDSVGIERRRANETIEHLQAENEQLLSMLASKGMSAEMVLDSVGVAPIAVSTEAFDRMNRDTHMFMQGHLPSFVDPAAKSGDAKSDLKKIHESPAEHLKCWNPSKLP